jgi:hypothetical protein
LWKHCTAIQGLLRDLCVLIALGSVFLQNENDFPEAVEEKVIKTETE